MTEFPRRSFLKGTGGLFGYAGFGGGSDAGGGGAAQLDGVPTTVVTTTKQLHSAFENFSQGDTILISADGAPYRTTEWLDVFVGD